MKIKLLLLGNMRHGKDTVAQLLTDIYGLTFRSSSEMASEVFLYNVLKSKYNYKTPQECFEDRVNHRKEWHDLITDYNTPDKTRLARAIMKKADVYVGMRSDAEAKACVDAGIFDYVIGVYDPRKPLESRESFNIDIWERSDFIIPNSGTLEELRERVEKLSNLM